MGYIILWFCKHVILWFTKHCWQSWHAWKCRYNIIWKTILFNIDTFSWHKVWNITTAQREFSGYEDLFSFTLLELFSRFNGIPYSTGPKWEIVSSVISKYIWKFLESLGITFERKYLDIRLHTSWNICL